ncbi:malonic semialdehyde reductase [Entomobacter blattae]|uniref:Putative malonic semialdehyde reductase RutE n=1 Tax=Entomobacter blattae TaxID=2762277 RepID=A0A7H1NP07_9PROT|nr:malonic semialdehyde reductase [Entomobacter blattae]QNT77517.1 putative malonic semialdehyde reductase RutE [Entomobacter blattae]
MNNLDNLVEILFENAHTAVAWQDRAVPATLPEQLYNHVKWGPTSANSSPARFVFLASKEVRQRLRPAIVAGNVEKIIEAPLVVLVAYDLQFYDQFPKLWPHEDLRSWYAADHVLAEETAQRNSTLQGGYMILAARALGFDVAPISGFDAALVEEIFLQGKNWRLNFIMGIGYADSTRQQPRKPRLDFEEACLLYPPPMDN